MIQFNCPECLQRITTKDEASGREGECTNCGARLLVPPPRGEATFACPHCVEAIPLDGEFAGKSILCPHCRQQVIMPAPPPIRSQASADLSPSLLGTLAGLVDPAPAVSRDAKNAEEKKWPNYKDALHPCPTCGFEIAYNAKTCPKCARIISEMDRAKWRWACMPESAKGATLITLACLVLFAVFVSVVSSSTSSPDRRAIAAGGNSEFDSATGTYSSKEWYEGGTLHDKTVREWRAATYENRLATCADFVMVSGDHISHPPDLKHRSRQLEACISSAVRGGEFDYKEVSEFAASCAILLGYRKLR